jgi:peptide/nickel transport system permease protein
VARYLTRRLALLILVIFGVVTATFILVHATPGDPARTYLGERATPEAVAALRKTWGLDQPLPQQYVEFFRQVFTGDLGNSLFFHAPNVQLIGTRLPVTLLLMLMATLFAVVISLPLATWIAVKGRGGADLTVRLFNAVVQGTPTFLVGSLFIVFFGVQLHWFPVGGYGSTFPEHLRALVLPALAVALGIVPLLVNSLRASLSDALQGEYVAFARSKGLRSSTVLGAYAIRNGSISGITILGIQAGNLAGGALVIENVFALPGMGTMMMTGILNRDFPVVQSVTLVFAAIVVLVYLFTDLAYALLDPRAKLA